MNFAARLMRIVHRKGSSKQPETTAATAAFPLPRDVLASILVRLPGSDLRRLRGVCKEWRDIISDPAFIRTHMVHVPRLLPTHTIVFFPGFSYGHDMNGRGFVFDKHWRLAAELAAGEWDDLIGTCNGLLCFLEIGQGSIKIIEPFTGESLAVPLPPEACRINPAAYCFGFDATARRYKIVHHGSTTREGEDVDDQELHMFTVGGGKQGWTRVHVASAVHGQPYGDPLHRNGAVYWPSISHVKGMRDEKLVRFDLATEKMTTEVTVRLPLDAPMRERPLFCRLGESIPFLITYGWHHEWDAWFSNGGAGCLPVGHVLLSDHCNGGRLYLRKMERNKLDLSKRKLLFKAGKEQPPGPGYNYNGQASFVSSRCRRQIPIAGAPSIKGGQCYARTSGYGPTVAAAPLALYLGTATP